jgi:2-iminobutanoate/2-iminopropanoate deaminase
MPRKALNSPDYGVPIAGFAHVVEAPADGRLLFVSGLTARDAAGSIVGVGDIEAQARQVFRNIEAVLLAAGATLDDLVQIRSYIRDIRDWPVVEAVWREFLSEPWPASTLVEISRLSDERQLIETDAIAVAPPGSSPRTPPNPTRKGARG